MMYNFFKCPECRQPMSLPSCTCDHTVIYNQGIYQLTDDPYMVKEDSAEVKYIGYEDIGEYYSGAPIFEEMRADEKYAKIAEIVGGGVLLDLACGDGLYTVPLIKQGVKTISMDISDKMLSLLYKRAEKAGADMSHAVVCRANALDIPLIDCSVDAVIANSMLHLISKPEAVVCEIHRVLKKGGKYITLQDKPNGSYFNDKDLTEGEKSENIKFKELVHFVHHRYFEILNNDYGIYGTRYSWKLDREKLCDKMFAGKEMHTISVDNKITDNFKDSFLYRMGGKGFSDQSDVPQDIHKEVFAKVMAEFAEKYGDDALNTVSVGFENDIEIIVYIK